MIIQKLHNCKLIFFNLKYCSPPMDCGCPRGSMIKWMVFSYPSNLYHIIYKPWLTKYPPSRLSTGFFVWKFILLFEFWICLTSKHWLNAEEPSPRIKVLFSIQEDRQNQLEKVKFSDQISFMGVQLCWGVFYRIS